MRVMISFNGVKRSVVPLVDVVRCWFRGSGNVEGVKSLAFRASTGVGCGSPSVYCQNCRWSPRPGDYGRRAAEESPSGWLPAHGPTSRKLPRCIRESIARQRVCAGEEYPDRLSLWRWFERRYAPTWPRARRQASRCHRRRWRASNSIGKKHHDDDSDRDDVGERSGRNGVGNESLTPWWKCYGNEHRQL